MTLPQRILADIAANGPADHLVIARRIGATNVSRVRGVIDAMANTGQITFDDTGRIASLTTQEPTT